MKVQCPNCNLTGNVNDATIPVTGLSMNCPRCKTPFQVNRPEGGESAAGVTTDTCPSCQYSTFTEEKFSVCPQCGLNVADHHRQAVEQRALEEKLKLKEKLRQQDDKARQKYGLDDTPKPVEKKPEVEIKERAPLPVQIVSWVVILVGVLLVLLAIKGGLGYMDQKSAAEAALQAQELAPSGTALFFRFGLSPLLFAPYGLALLVVGSQFLNLQYLAIQRLSSVAWAGVALAVVQEIIDFISWVQRGSSSPSASYYLTGIFSTLLMAVLWIIPLLILIKYLESVEFERLKPVFH